MSIPPAKKVTEILPAEKNTSASSWALPAVEGKVINRQTVRPGDNKKAQKKVSELTKPQRKEAEAQTSHSGAPQATAEITESQLQQIRQAAFEEGYANGQAQGIEAGKEQLNQLLEQISSVCDALAEPKKLLDEKVEEELVHLATIIANHIIRREIRTEPSQVLAVVREAISALPSSAEKIKITLHPEDAQLVRKAYSMRQEDDDERSWVIVEDPSIFRGGCRVQTEHSMIDATIQKRINAIAGHLLGAERKRDHDDDVEMPGPAEEAHSEVAHGEAAANEASNIKQNPPVKDPGSTGPGIKEPPGTPTAPDDTPIEEPPNRDPQQPPVNPPPSDDEQSDGR